MWFLQHGFRCRADIVHCHYGWTWSLPMWLMTLCGYPIVMTFHDQMLHEKWLLASRSARFAGRRLFRNPRVWWVAVNSNVKERLMKLGVAGERIRVIPAYLPPPPADLSAALPNHVLDFIRDHTPVLSTYGWRLCFDSQGRDLYGFDLCIELVHHLKARHPSVGLVVCLPQVALPDYYAVLRQRIVEHGIEGHVLFVTDPLDEAFPLWQASDLYLRATSSDGDSLAVREAISLGVPVVASDASPRPAGTVVFPSRNLDALVAAVVGTLARKRQSATPQPKLECGDCFHSLMDLYRTVLES